MTTIIGLTGGIGSGKSTIADYFKSEGIPVYIADEEGRKLTGLPEVTDAIKSTFGDSVIANGKVERSKLASIVFNAPQKLAELNAIIHPAVKQHFSKWLAEHQKYPMVIRESAILFESETYKDCDFIISVSAPVETRIQRVMQRDNLDRESVLNRVKNQWTDEQRNSKSDFIIQNIDAEEARNQASKILKKISILQNKD